MNFNHNLDHPPIRQYSTDLTYRYLKNIHHQNLKTRCHIHHYRDRRYHIKHNHFLLQYLHPTSSAPHLCSIQISICLHPDHLKQESTFLFPPKFPSQ